MATSFPEYISALFIMVTIIPPFFLLLEEFYFKKNEQKDMASSWLGSVSQESWSVSCIKFFNWVYGKKHFSSRCILFSSIVSFIGVMIFSSIFSYFNFFGEDFRFRDDISIVKIAFWGVILNFIPDYLSLIETRWILKRVSRYKELYQQAAIVILDIVFSASIILLYMAAIFTIFDLAELSIMKVITILSIYSIFFYSTFMSSLWVWIYFSSLWVMKVFQRMIPNKLIDIENKPIRYIGVCIAISIFFIGFSIWPFVKISDQSGINNFEKLACKISSSTCEHLAHLTTDEHHKLNYIAKACLGGMSEQCVVSGINSEKRLLEKACENNLSEGCALLSVHYIGTKKGQELIDKAITLDKDSSENYMLRGLVLGSNLYDPVSAEFALRKAIKLDQNIDKKKLGVNEITVNFLLANTLMSQGRYEEAKGVLLQNSKNYNNNNSRLLAMVHLVLHEYNQAEKVQLKLLENDSKNTSVYNTLMQIYKHQQKFEQTEALFEKVISKKIENAHTYVIIMQSLYKEKKHDKLKIIINEALDKFQKDDYLHSKIGAMYYETKNLEKARNHFSTALSLSPKNKNYRQSLIRILRDEKKYFQAMLHEQQLISIELQ